MNGWGVRGGEPEMSIGDDQQPERDPEGGPDPDEDAGEELEAMIEQADRPFASDSFGTTAEEQEETARFMGRRMLTGYAIVPAYNASLARQGFEDEAKEIAEAWAAGERDRATEAFSDRMLDELFVTGDAEACRSRIEEYRQAGVRTPVIMPLSFAGSAEERAERVAKAVELLAPSR